MRTQEQMEIETQTARQVNILLVAQHFGYSFKGGGNAHIVKGTKGGLVLFEGTNSFYDYYTKKGGSVIDFVMQEQGFSIREAIRYLNEFAGYQYDEERYMTAKIQTSEKRNRELVMPDRNFNHKRVFAYLTKTRGIDKGIVSELLHRRLLYESAEKHNAVFVAYDRSGNAKHGFIRGTITGMQYRGDVEGSDKEYGFSMEGLSDQLVVFEAPIDLLSYMSIQQSEEHLIALGGLFVSPIFKYIEEHPNIRTVSFLLDNDEQGISATCQFSAEMEKRGITVTDNSVADAMKKAGVKDVNEYLLKIRGKEKIFECQKGTANARR